MQSTTNYSMNLVEGTDIVNIPVQLNPNFQTIDGAMFDNKQASVGTATEVVTGTAHAIVRNNPDSDVFRFTATGAWTSGDTMSVDGNAVTVHLSDGTVPPTGAYIIGAEVLAVINSSLVTLMIGMTPPAQGVTSFNSRTGAVVPTAGDYVAGDIDYDNTGSGLTATEVQSAIDEITDMTKHGVYELWTNPDASAAFNAQNVLIDTPLNVDSFLIESAGGELYIIEASNGSSVSFTKTAVRVGQGQIRYILRQLSITKLGTTHTLTFGDCTIYDLTSYGSAATGVTNNSNIVPVRIFGIIHNS